MMQPPKIKRGYDGRGLSLTHSSVPQSIISPHDNGVLRLQFLVVDSVSKPLQCWPAPSARLGHTFGFRLTVAAVGPVTQGLPLYTVSYFFTVDRKVSMNGRLSRDLWWWWWCCCRRLLTCYSPAPQSALSCSLCSYRPSSYPSSRGPRPQTAARRAI